MAFPYLKPTATSSSGRGVLEFAFPHLDPTATKSSKRGEGEHVRLERRRAVAAVSLLRGAWLRGAAHEAQAPLPLLKGAAFETRTLLAEFVPRLAETALLVQVPFAQLGPWSRETAYEACVPAVEIVPWLRATAQDTLVPFTGTELSEYATDGEGARGFVTEAINAALLDRLATGTYEDPVKLTEVPPTVRSANGPGVPYRRRAVTCRCESYLAGARSGFRSG